MPRPETDGAEQDNGLPVPGSRWGQGAQSVLPYLTKTLQARPAHAPEPRERSVAESADTRQGTSRAPR